jgi:hypothetical protein
MVNIRRPRSFQDPAPPGGEGGRPVGDHLTVLRSVNRRFATKRITRHPQTGEISNRGYDLERHFAVEIIAVASLTELSVVLTRLTTQPYEFVVRGEPLPGIDRDHARRLLHRDPETGDEPTFEPAVRHWFAVDMDDIAAAALSDPVTDPDGAIDYLIGLLPPELFDVDCWWQFTASQGLPGCEGLLSARLWFWSERRYSDAELKRWAAAHNARIGRKIIDPALYTGVQPHYVANPVFTGMADPLPKRYGIHQGLDATACLMIPPAHGAKDPERVSGAGDAPGRGTAAYLAEIGGVEGFRTAIVGAIASYIASHGNNADMRPLYAAIRKRLDEVEAGWRDDPKGKRYVDDAHLDKIAEWVRQQHGDRPPKGLIARPRERAAGPPGSGTKAALRDDAAIGLNDFLAYMPQHRYMYVPSRELWPAESINGRFGKVTVGLDANGKPIEIAASRWLDQHRPIEQMTWAPGEPTIIADRLIAEGGWLAHPGASCFNLYLPPKRRHGDPDKAGPWLEHIARIYAEDAKHIICWLAHRVQHPEQKINHALVLGGAQGIGKDTLLEPVKRAIGPWNFREATPTDVMDRYNDFVKGVVLRINEIKDLGETDRFKFYEHMKTYTAAPPDVLRCNEKYIRQYAVLNVCGVIYTTNHKSDGLYLPAGDRRHYVGWSTCKKEDFDDDYWPRIWGFFDNGGDAQVAAFLAGHDLTGFDAKAPPPKTAAFWDIVNAHRAPEDAELADALDYLTWVDAVRRRKMPPAEANLLLRQGRLAPVPAITIEDLLSSPLDDDFRDWLQDRRYRRQIPHRLESCNYVSVRNAPRMMGCGRSAASGRWSTRTRRSRWRSRSRRRASCSDGRGVGEVSEVSDPPLVFINPAIPHFHVAKIRPGGALCLGITIGKSLTPLTSPTGDQPSGPLPKSRQQQRRRLQTKFEDLSARWYLQASAAPRRDER